MNKLIILDTGPLGRLAHPKPNKEISEWFIKQLSAGSQFFIPEVVDYELRRSFLLHNLTKSIARLEELEHTLTYLPITTNIMHKAAALWAEARKTGKPTSSDAALDADVIIAAQALQIGAMVVTENPDHLTRFVEAKHWHDIGINSSSP